LTVKIPPMSSLVERVEMARADRTDAEILRRAGLKEDILRNLRSGKAQMPRVDTALKLAHGLGVNPSWLAFEIGPMVMSDQDEIAQILAEMPNEFRAEALAFLRGWRHLKQPGHLRLIGDFVRHLSPVDASPPTQGDAGQAADEPSPQ
jgi:transcriptional regulator with XRE-family HTH domain